MQHFKYMQAKSSPILHNLVGLAPLSLLISLLPYLVKIWQRYSLHGDSQDQVGNNNIGQGFPKHWWGTTSFSHWHVAKSYAMQHIPRMPLCLLSAEFARVGQTNEPVGLRILLRMMLFNVVYQPSLAFLGHKTKPCSSYMTHWISTAVQMLAWWAVGQTCYLCSARALRSEVERDLIQRWWPTLSPNSQMCCRLCLCHQWCDSATIFHHLCGLLPAVIASSAHNTHHWFSHHDE